MKKISKECLVEIIENESDIEIKKLSIWNILGKYMQSVLYKKFKYVGNMVGFEYDDYYTIAYLAYYDLIKNSIDINETFRTKGFITFLMNKCIWYCSDYLRKYMTSKQKVMNINNIVEFSDDIILETSNIYLDQKYTEESMINRLAAEELIKKIINSNKLSADEKVRMSKYISLIIEGNTKKEIISLLCSDYVEIRKFDKLIKEKSWTINY